MRFEGVRETEKHADTEAEEWRKATKVKLGTDFEARRRAAASGSDILFF